MTDWVRWGYDLGSSGLNAAETGSGNNLDPARIASVNVLWASPVLDGKIECQVLKVGSFIYVVTRGGTFYKLNIADGTIAGSYAIGAPSSSTPHIIGGIAYFGDDLGYFHAVNVTTMAVVWRVQTGLDTAPITSHPVVSGTRVFFGQSNYLRALLIASGAESWSRALITAAGSALGPLAFWSGNVYGAVGEGVYEYSAAGTAGKTFGARAQCYGVAIQTHTNGKDFLCFASADSYGYAYDRATGVRLWAEGHQGGDMKCPIGLDLTRVGTYGTGFAIMGTHNWSIQPHAAEGGDLIWKRDATAGSAITSGCCIANGVFAGVWPLSVSGGDGDGRVAAFILNQSRGGHVSDWKFGTSTGNQGSPSSANKAPATPIMVDGKIFCGFGDKIVRAFA